MSVPKTAMNEYDSMQTWKYKVRTTGKLAFV